MEWSLVTPIDVLQIIDTFEVIYKEESTLGYDREFMNRTLTVASTVQMFDKSKEFIAKCKIGEKVVGICWFDRGGYAPYSTKEICNSKFHHVDLSLPIRVRYKLINQMIDQHLLWAYHWGIPMVCSTSVRKDYQGFMRIHAKRGFRVHGSFAYMDVKEWYENQRRTDSN